MECVLIGCDSVTLSRIGNEVKRLRICHFNLYFGGGVFMDIMRSVSFVCCGFFRLTE